MFTDMARMTLPLADAFLNPTRDKAETLVIVLPGFGAGDASTAPMRSWLNRRGFDAHHAALSGGGVDNFELRSTAPVPFIVFQPPNQMNPPALQECIAERCSETAPDQRIDPRASTFNRQL